MSDFDNRTNTDMDSHNPQRDTGASPGRHRVDWGSQDSYWRDNYGSRPYTTADRRYEYYQPAYKYGHEAAFLFGGRAWDTEIEHDLERGWDQARGESTCEWSEVRDAVRDAYERAR